MRGSHIGRPQDSRAESETVVDRDPAVGDPLPPAVVLATPAATVGAAFLPVRQDGLGGHPGNDRILPAFSVRTWGALSLQCDVILV